MDDTTVGDDELRVSIEAGKDYPMMPRLAAALDELEAALQEADENEVAGFGLQGFSGFSLNYLSPTSSSYVKFVDKSSPDRQFNEGKHFP
jgi:hypothetical protein